jgi:5-methylcytosine-specific restriction endonuclease McrA
MPSCYHETAAELKAMHERAYYQSAAWRDLRQKVLERDGLRCRGCGATTRLEIHHIRYAADPADDSIEDLITLCGGPNGCHRAITAAIERRAYDTRNRDRVVEEAAKALADKATARKLTKMEAEPRCSSNLRDVFGYDPDSGVLTWNAPVSRKLKVGQEAGCFHKSGRRIVNISGALVYTHCIAWYLHYGTWPEKHITHIDGDLANNSIANLRYANPATDLRFTKILRRDSKSGFKGVSKHADNLYSARIYINGKRINLGAFRTAEEASQAYRDAASKYFGWNFDEPASKSPDVADRLFSYDAENGSLIWRVSTSPRNKIGSPAGCTNSMGYRVVQFCGKTVYSHQIAWLMTYRVWPDHEIDHIDGNPSNNAISNLRAATRTENNRNTGIRSNNKLGAKGVLKHSDGRFRARIMVDRKTIHLGLFDTIEEAASAYAAASERYHGSFGRTE